MKRFSKGISPVVALALLLVVAVVAVSSFQGWIQTYQSSLFADVEIQSKQAIDGSLIIEDLIGDTLYLLNNIKDNLSINELKIGDNTCVVDDNLYLGINEIHVAGCLDSVDTTPYIVVIADTKVVEKQILIEKSNSLDCTTLNGGEWIKVPGNILYGTSAFCVMKYEAKWNGSGTINNVGSAYCGDGSNYNLSTGCIDDTEGVISQPNSLPLRNVNQFEAKVLCERLGSGYHLITNNEWMTIARLITNNPTNWADETIGSIVASSGGLYRGNVGETTSVGCGSFTILDADTAGSNCLDGTRNMRTLNISGELIWDLSGNVWEWTDNTIDCSGGYSCANMPYDSTPDSEWIELTALDTGTYGSLSYNLIRPINSTWNASYGMGRLQTANDYSYPNDGSWNTTHAFLRGGATGEYAGVFALSLTSSPSISYTGYGFRCSYTP